jgi:hypothetical protein
VVVGRLAEDALASTQQNKRALRLGRWTTVATVVVVLGAATLTLFGLGAFDRAVAVYNPSAWLFSKAKGELGRVDGGTAKVDTRVKVDGTTGHRVEVSQTDRYLIVRDLDTGVVNALDLSSLQVAGSLDTTAGLGVQVVVHGRSAYVIDRVRGEVRRLDPLTLVPLGQPLTFSPGLRGGEFDNDGTLWLALPGEGTVVALSTPDDPNAAPTVRTEPVADPNHELVVSVLDKGVAVLDDTAGKLVTVRGGDVARTDLTLSGPGAMPDRTRGDRITVTVPDGRQVYVVGSGPVANFQVPGSGAGMSPAVPWSGHFYVADDQAGVVYELDEAGTLVDQIRLPGQAGHLALEARDDFLYINAVDAGSAWVVDRNHKVSVVDKYPTNVLGSDPLPTPPTPPAPPPPVTGPPGAPSSVVASAGDARAHLSWGPAPSNGSAILKYVIEGGGQHLEVGADQRVMDVSGLTNGTTYTFTVNAVSALGAGPKRASNPVVPTSAVPNPPASVTAKEQKDGTVGVSWTAADAKSGRVGSYQITAVGPTGPAQTWQVDGAKTAFSTPAGALTYGTQYAFTATTVNDKGAGSKPSALSNSVAPYTVPAAPSNLKASPGSKAGVVHVSWAASAANGRPVVKYVVGYNGASKDVTGTTSVDLTGLADGANVSVTVTAVNAAGSGPAAGPKVAKTIANPTITLTGKSVGYNSISVSFTVNEGGGTGHCKLDVTGAGGAPGNCNNITMNGLAPGVGYTYTVTVTNEAGSAKGTGAATTTALSGTVRCVSTNGYCDSGVGIYSKPMQDTSAATTWDGHNGKRYQAYCKIAGGNGNLQAGATLTAAQYNNHKTSNMWVKISGNSERYIPYAWFNLDANDNLGLLPPC